MNSSWLNFANEDLWRRLPTSTADTLMADNADVGQASPAAAIAVKGQVWYGCWGFVDLPPVALLPEVGSTGVFNGGDDLVDGAETGLTVSCKYGSLVVVNVAGTEGLLEGVFKTFIWYPSVMVASGEFTIQGFVQGIPPILETCPAHRSSDLSNITSILVISDWSRTSTLET